MQPGTEQNGLLTSSSENGNTLKWALIMLLGAVSLFGWCELARMKINEVFAVDNIDYHPQILQLII